MDTRRLPNRENDGTYRTRVANLLQSAKFLAGELVGSGDGHLANMVAQFKLATAEFKFRKLEQIAKGRAAFVLYVAICNGR
jgi:hypothetical protein